MTDQRPVPTLDPADVAVIVPVLNEAERLPALLDDLVDQGFGRIVAVDGGSIDDSRVIAGARPQVTLVSSPRGRAAQQNAGAAAAGEARVLLFLHADTRLPPDAIACMDEVLATGVCAGAFRLRFDRRHPLLALYAAASAIESFWTTFGDQAIFARREAFDAVGGFAPWPLLEDVALRRALKRHGGFAKSRDAVVTSARRFEAEGLLQRQLKNGAILLLHALGAPAQRLVRWYR